DVGNAGRERAGAVGAEHRHAAWPDVVVGAHHVVHGDALGDADDGADTGVHRLVNRVGGESWRHEHHRGVGAALRHGLGNGVEYRHSIDVLSALARGHAGHQVGAVVAVSQRVEAALAAG